MKPVTSRRDMLRFSGAAMAMGAALPWHAWAQGAGPKGVPPTIAMLARSPAVSHICLSPDGSRFAYVTSAGDEKLIVITEIGDDSTKKIDIGAVKVMGMDWADNTRLSLRHAFTQKDSWNRYGTYETANGFLIDTVALKSTPLFASDSDYLSLVASPISRHKDAKGYFACAVGLTYVNSSYHAHLCRIDLDTGKATVIDDGGVDDPRWVLTAEGRPVARSQYDDQTHVFSISFNQAAPGQVNSWKRVYSVTQALDYPYMEGLGRSQTSVLIYISRGDLAGAYYELGPDGTLSPALSGNQPGDVGALHNPATRVLAGFAYDQDWWVYDYTDPLLKKLYGALGDALPDYRFSIADFAEDPRKLIFYGESAEDAGSYFFIDFSTGDVKSIASNYDGLPTEWLTQKQKIAYKAADGLDIAAYLTLPPFRGTKNLPLVVMPHGGPEAHDTLAYDWEVQAYATRGYAVLQPNYRGSSGYGQDFIDAGHGEFGRKMQTDLSDGVRYLAAQGTIDPKRVSIVGASYGGYAALAGVTIDRGVYNCAVSIAGIADCKMLIDSEVSQSDTAKSEAVLYWQRYLGDASGYDAISPVKHAADITVPVLLLHGTDDSVVPIQQSQAMEKAMKAAGKDVTLTIFKGEDHWETLASSRIDMLTAAVDFVTRHNPPDALV